MKINRLINFLKINKTSALILTNFSLLLFVLNIPGTIALRNLLAALLMIILTSCWLKEKISIKSIMNVEHFKIIFILLALLTFYIFIHSIFIADEISWSLTQYRTQWIYPMIYFFMGMSLASLASYNKYFRIKTLIAFLFYSLLLHVVYIDIVAVLHYFETGTFLWRYGGLTKSPVLSSYVSNILIAMIFVEILYRAKENKRILQVGPYWLSLILILCLIESIIGGVRFGVVILFFISLSAVVLFVIDNNNFNTRVRVLVSLAILILCTLPVLYSANNDDRWASLYETIPIALDTQNNTFWKDNNNPPKLENGNNVSHSNYMRIAWAAKGVEYIRNDIFGIGYGRNAFGHAIEKYEKNNESIRGKHSHSGIIDFTIGVGLFGLSLWLILVSRIVIYSLGQYINFGNYFALLSLFFTASFFIRSIVDSNMRDHMFKQFFLILGIFLTLSAYEYNKKIKDG